MSSPSPLVMTEVLGRVSRAWAWFSSSPAFEEQVERAAAILTREAFDRLHWEDVALLDGFRRGLAQPAAVVHQTVAKRLVELLVQKGAEPMDADDLVQERLCSLFDGSTPTYAGRGPLIGWLRTSLLRDLALLRETRERHTRSTPSTPVAGPLMNLESELSAHHHRPHLRAVLRAIFASLDPQSRRILRLIYAGGLTAQQVGALLGLHRVTVQNKLRELRDDIDRRTRRDLAHRFGLDESTIGGLLDPERLRFDTSLSSVLASSSIG